MFQAYCPRNVYYCNKDFHFYCHNWTDVKNCRLCQPNNTMPFTPLFPLLQKDNNSIWRRPIKEHLFFFSCHIWNNPFFALWSFSLIFTFLATEGQFDHFHITTVPTPKVATHDRIRMSKETPSNSRGLGPTPNLARRPST